MADEFAVCPLAIDAAERSTGETRGPPADGDDDTDGATAAPETGPAGIEGTAGGATTGGRRSAPYAGSGPAATAGPLTAGAAGIGAPVTTAGVTDAVPLSPVDITGGPAGVAAASTAGCIAADSIPTAAMVGAATVGGVRGAGVCAGEAEPGSIACIAPADNDCAPAAAGCPVIIPVATDCPNDAGDMPCPAVVGDSPPPGIVGAGIPVPITGGGAGAGPVGVVLRVPVLRCHSNSNYQSLAAKLAGSPPVRRSR